MYINQCQLSFIMIFLIIHIVKSVFLGYTAHAYSLKTTH